MIPGIQPPGAQTEGVDDKRIAFPVTYCVPHERPARAIRVQVFGVRAAIQWNGTIEMIIFVMDGQILIPLYELLRVRRQSNSRHTVRVAE